MIEIYSLQVERFIEEKKPFTARRKKWEQENQMTSIFEEIECHMIVKMKSKYNTICRVFLQSKSKREIEMRGCALSLKDETETHVL